MAASPGRAESPADEESTDPILAVHLRRRGFVDLAGRLTPGSIRDQILRSILVTGALWRSGFLTAQSRMLVIGAGAAGLASALQASSWGVHVWLVEKESEPLPVFRNNTLRVVSPAIYDWPASHWIETTFGANPLIYREGTPSILADEWHRSLEKALGKQPHLRWCPNVEASDVWQTGTQWQARFVSSDAQGIPPDLSASPFDIVYKCCGNSWPTEGSINWANGPRAEFPIFRFWDDDPFAGTGQRFYLRDKPRLNQDGQARWRSADEHTQVAILGGGDGGLQEFLRFVTGGKPPRQILEKVATTLRHQGYAYRTLYNLVDSEQRFSRHFALWPPDRARELTEAAYEECRREVESLYLASETRRQALYPVLKELVVFHDVLLFIAGNTFSRSYPLNRFLVLLFDAHLRDSFQSSRLRFGMTAQQIECLHDHETGSPSAVEHYEGSHLLHLQNAQNKSVTVASRTVVCRLGPPATDKGILKARQVRQILPCWAPGWGPSITRWRLSGGASGIDLESDRGCRSALWRWLGATAVIKDSQGRVITCNSRFAQFFGKDFEQIVSRTASDYAGPELGAAIEAHDQQVRSTLCSLLTFSTAGGRAHYTFRFPYPLEQGGLGSASLGLSSEDLAGCQPLKNMLAEPSPEILERYFEWLPCSVALTDQSHRYIFANQAFRRVLAPPGFAALPSVDLYGYSWDQILSRLGDPAEREDPDNDRKKTIRDKGAGPSWPSTPPWGRNKRVVMGFPILDAHGKFRAIATIGFLDILDQARSSGPNIPLPYQIEP